MNQESTMTQETLPNTASKILPTSSTPSLMEQDVRQNLSFRDLESVSGDVFAPAAGSIRIQPELSASTLGHVVEHSGAASKSKNRFVALHVPSLRLRLLMVSDPSLRDSAWVLASQAEGAHARIEDVSPAARRRGIDSGMRLSDLRRRFSDVRVIPPNPSLLARFRRILSTLCDARTPVWEVDDDGSAILDLGGVSHLFQGDHEAWAGQLRTDLRQATGLDDIHIALAGSRGAAEILARVHGELPLFCCPENDDGAVLGSIPLDRVPWLGKQAKEKLDRYRLRTLGDVRRFPRSFLKLHFGEVGEKLAALAAGLEVEPAGGSCKSLSEELVLPRDEVDFEAARERVHELADRLSFALRERSLTAREVRLRLSWSDGQELSSMVRSIKPCDGFLELRDMAWKLLAELSTRRVSLRALRLSASRTETLATQEDLFAPPEREEQRRIGMALDHVRRRQGFEAVRNALNIAA